MRGHGNTLTDACQCFVTRGLRIHADLTQGAAPRNPRPLADACLSGRDSKEQAAPSATLLQGSGQPEPVAVVTEGRAEPDAHRRAPELGIVAPRAAAQYAHGAVLARAAIHGSALIVLVICVFHPFPYVAAHVVKPEGIGLLGGNRMRGVEEEAAAVDVVPR